MAPKGGIRQRMAYMMAEEAASSSGHPPKKRTGGEGKQQNERKGKGRTRGEGKQKKENERHGGKKRKGPEPVPDLVDESDDEVDAAALKAQQEYKKALQDKTINI